MEREVLEQHNHKPPVPSPLVKSPPWIMKSLMHRWNLLFLYPNPFWNVNKIKLTKFHLVSEAAAAAALKVALLTMV